jgi:hypothetical protein
LFNQVVFVQSCEVRMLALLGDIFVALDIMSSVKCLQDQERKTVADLLKMLHDHSGHRCQPSINLWRAENALPLRKLAHELFLA